LQHIFTFFLALVYCGAVGQSSMATADSLYALGNYTKAINTYATIGSEQASLQIARAYNAVKNYEKAIAQYQGILDKNNTLPIAQFELGKLYLKVKRARDSEAIFQQLQDLTSTNPEYGYFLGRSLQMQDKDSSAMIHFKKAVNIDSTHLRSLYQLSKFYVQERLKDSVVKFADLGLDFYSTDVTLLNLKAQAYFNNDQYEKAIPLFEKLLELNEKKVYIYEKLAYAYLESSELKKAKQTYAVALRLVPGKAINLFKLGEVHWRERKLDSAEFYFKEAIAAKKTSNEAEYVSLARLKQKQKKFKQAANYYKLAEQENSRNPRYAYQRCVLLDQYYKEPKAKLKCYQEFKLKIGTREDYFSRFADRRIKELKEEIHFTSD